MPHCLVSERHLLEGMAGYKGREASEEHTAQGLVGSLVPVEVIEGDRGISSIDLGAQIRTTAKYARRLHLLPEFSVGCH